MNMDIMVKPEEPIDGLEIGGVAAYRQASDRAGVNLLIEALNALPGETSLLRAFPLSVYVPTEDLRLCCPLRDQPRACDNRDWQGIMCP